MNSQIATTSQQPRLDWVNTLFLITTLVVAIIGVPVHAALTGFSWPILGLFVFYLAATGLSITGGYHRLFAHQSFQANAVVRAFFLIFGAAACQNSALKWAADHRDHHLYVDQDRDPYNIGKGFFWSHMEWIFYQTPPVLDNVKDLMKDPLVRWQNRYYIPTAIITGGVVPLLFGLWVGDGWGSFLLVGVARTVIVHHSTFLINSLCHYFGNQPYSLENSSRDSGLVALLTYGEGYHNFHHQFQYDYRNGIKWYHWDPTKWLIKSLALVGWADRLRTAQSAHIFKARLEVQRARAHENLAQRSHEFRVAMEHKIHCAHEALVTARARWERVKVEYRAAKRSMDVTRHILVTTLEADFIVARDHFRKTQASWSLLLAHANACA